MNWNVVSSLLSLISILVAVATFFSDRKRAMKVDTIKELDRILDRYYEIRDLDLNKNYKEFCALTSDISRFAYAVNTGVYDSKIVKERASRTFLKMYVMFMKSVIEKHRLQFKDETYYQGIETMLNSFPHPFLSLN